ncbi:MAG: hypothetical protein ABSF45_13225 [Terriglobia bacterium]|jgi:hypothetical protein
MRTTFLAGALLVLTVGGPMASAQEKQPAAHPFGLSSIDLAFTYTPERANVASSGGSFWLRGESADAAFTFFHGLGMAASVTGVRASNIAPSVSLGKLAIMGGPRYTLRVGSKHENRVFAEALFGGVHAFDSAFPTSTGITPTANSFSLLLGGGWDVAVSKHFAIRAIEADYVRTSLPNNGTNTQDYLRLAFGVSYHIQRH